MWTFSWRTTTKNTRIEVGVTCILCAFISHMHCRNQIIQTERAERRIGDLGSVSIAIHEIAYFSDSPASARCTSAAPAYFPVQDGGAQNTIALLSWLFRKLNFSGSEISTWTSLLLLGLVASREMNLHQVPHRSRSHLRSAHFP